MRRPHAGETEEDLLAQMRQFEEESKKKSGSQQSNNLTSPSNLKRPHSDETYVEPKPVISRVLSAVVVERPIANGMLIAQRNKYVLYNSLPKYKLTLRL